MEIKNKKWVINRKLILCSDFKSTAKAVNFATQICHSKSFFQWLNLKIKRPFLLLCFVTLSWARNKATTEESLGFQGVDGRTSNNYMINVIKSNIIELIIHCRKMVESVDYNYHNIFIIIKLFGHIQDHLLLLVSFIHPVLWYIGNSRQTLVENYKCIRVVVLGRWVDVNKRTVMTHF